MIKLSVKTGDLFVQSFLTFRILIFLPFLVIEVRLLPA